MPKDVSVVGPLNIDLLVNGEGPPNWEAIPTWDGPAVIQMAAAGSVGYTVQGLAKLGLSVQVGSALPDEPLGVFILDTLQRAGIDTELVRTTPGSAGGIAVYMLLFGSRKRPLAYHLPTHELWPAQFSPQEIECLLDARLLHQGGYLHYQDAWHGGTRDLFKAAKQRGLATSMDPQFPLFAMDPPWLVALEDVLPYVELLFCDETEACKITAQPDLDRAAAVLLDTGIQTLIIKQGSEGSTVYQKTWQHHQPAIILGDLVDSIGAGDVFDASVLYGWQQRWSWEKCLLFASVAAGFTVTGIGGTQNLPDLPVILAEMRKRERV
jgi:2-dehydro-3-deoxygluconokinase